MKIRDRVAILTGASSGIGVLGTLGPTWLLSRAAESADTGRTLRHVVLGKLRS